MSVEELPDNGHTTIFYPYQQEVTVHANNDVTITTKNIVLQVWRHAQGLWHIPLINNATHTITWDCPAPSVAVSGVYELPTTEHMVRYLHAALGFPTKATLLSTTHKGTLPDSLDFLLRTSSQSDKTQKGHMHQQKQGQKCLMKMQC